MYCLLLFTSTCLPDILMPLSVANTTVIFFLEPLPGDGHHSIEWPGINTSTAVGITVAIAGNVFISLALNIQKLAHRRLEIEARQCDLGGQLSGTRTNRNAIPGCVDGDEDIETGRSPVDEHDVVFGRPVIDTPAAPGLNGKSLPLVSASDTQLPTRIYSSRSAAQSTQSILHHKSPRSWRQKDSFFRWPSTWERSPLLVPAQGETGQGSLDGLQNGSHIKNQYGNPLNDGAGNESDYLKSRLW
jgi:hypothetical protein